MKKPATEKNYKYQFLCESRYCNGRTKIRVETQTPIHEALMPCPACRVVIQGKKV